jgi:ankyrin repeat protein
MSLLGTLFNIPPLVEAAEEGNLPLVRYLVENGADVNVRGMLNTTPLMVAAQYGRNDVAAYLLSLPQTDINALNDGGTTALQIAIRAKHRVIFDAIIADPRLDINVSGRFGGCALSEAAAWGLMDYVTALLKIPGIRHEANYTRHKYSPASLARHNGHPHIAAVIEAHFGLPPQHPPAPQP